MEKINNLHKHNGTGTPETRGPMQLHRLYQLKASPDAHGVMLDLCDCGPRN